MTAPAMVTVFSALADETRLDIVTRLANGDATLSELAEHYEMSIQAVSTHLSVLEDAGVVTAAARHSVDRSDWKRRCSTS